MLKTLLTPPPFPNPFFLNSILDISPKQYKAYSMNIKSNI